MQLVSDAMQVQVLLFHWMSCVAVLFMQGLPANGHHDKHKNCCDMSAGKQAEVLNILLEDLLEGHAVSETKLKEVLGHTPIQVLTLVCSLHVAPVSFPYEFKAVNCLVACQWRTSLHIATIQNLRMPAGWRRRTFGVISWALLSNPSSYISGLKSAICPLARHVAHFLSAVFRVELRQIIHP